MATTEAASDEKTPILSSVSRGRDTSHADDHRATCSFIGATVLLPILLVAALFAAFTVEHPTKGYRPPMGSGVHTYVLDARCVSAETRALNPIFFRHGAVVVAASIVRHDPSTAGLGVDADPTARGMNSNSALGMRRPGADERFIIETDALDGDWGFAIRNNYDDVFYEVGDDEGAPMWDRVCETRAFGERIRDLVRGWIPSLREGRRGRTVEYVFGSCDRRCPPETDRSGGDEGRLSRRARSENRRGGGGGGGGDGWGNA